MEAFFPKELKIFKFLGILTCLGSANLCLNNFLKNFKFDMLID
jgi:hypothetical protein